MKPAGVALALVAGLFCTQVPAGGTDPTVCAELASPQQEAFERLATRYDVELREGGTAVRTSLADCGLDYFVLHERQCNRAYVQQNLEFLLRHCEYQAWALARAQCERNLDSISPRYAAYCKAFGRE
jgi:hypothetical protein